MEKSKAETEKQKAPKDVGQCCQMCRGNCNILSVSISCLKKKKKKGHKCFGGASWTAGKPQVVSLAGCIISVSAECYVSQSCDLNHSHASSVWAWNASQRVTTVLLHLWNINTTFIFQYFKSFSLFHESAHQRSKNQSNRAPGPESCLPK